MAEKNHYTRPYKQIVIDVHPDFVPRLSTLRKGAWCKGITSNLGMYGYMAFLFEVNEYLPKAHKLTDFQLAKLIAAEHPSRKVAQQVLYLECHPEKKSRYTCTVAYFRGRYNRGKILTEHGRHGPISFRYNASGERVSNRNPNRPLSPREYENILTRYGPERRDTQDFDWKAIVKRTKQPKRQPDSDYDSFNWVI